MGCVADLDHASKRASVPFKFMSKWRGDAFRFWMPEERAIDFKLRSARSRRPPNMVLTTSSSDVGYVLRAPLAPIGHKI